MREIKLAIISNRRDISRFFELEAMNCGFDVSVLEKSRPNISEYDMCVLDLQGMRQLPTMLPAHVICIIDEKNEQRFVNDMPSDAITITMPISVRTLRQIYESVYHHGELDKSKIFANGNDSRVYFCRSPENTVRLGDRNIQLSDYEARILERLCRSCGSPVSRDELNALLGAENGNIADVYICRLRKKLESEDAKRLIFTVRSQGYKIMADVEWE